MNNRLTIEEIQRLRNDVLDSVKYWIKENCLNPGELLQEIQMLVHNQYRERYGRTINSYDYFFIYYGVKSKLRKQIEKDSL